MAERFVISTLKTKQVGKLVLESAMTRGIPKIDREDVIERYLARKDRKGKAALPGADQAT